MILREKVNITYIYVTFLAEEEEDESEAGPESDKILMNDKRIFIVTGSPIEFRKGGDILYLSNVTYASTELNKTNIKLDVKFNGHVRITLMTMTSQKIQKRATTVLV